MKISLSVAERVKQEEWRERLGGFQHFMLGPQTSGAQVETLELTVYGNRGRVYIRYPAAVGMPLGMAYIVTEL